MALREGGFGLGDGRDHAFVALLGGVAPGEEAVLVEDHELGEVASRGALLPQRRDLLGEREPGHRVGDHEHGVAVDRADAGGAVRLVGDREEGVRVRVVDEFAGDDRVEERLDGGLRSRPVDRLAAELLHHLLVGERRERGELAEALDAHGGEALWADGAEVAAAAFDVEDGDCLACRLGDGSLDAGVAAAVQDEPRIAPEEARSVDAEREILPVLGAELAEDLLGFFSVVAREHQRALKQISAAKGTHQNGPSRRVGAPV